jgi:hypothetical protein
VNFLNKEILITKTRQHGNISKNTYVSPRSKIHGEFDKFGVFTLAV